MTPILVVICAFFGYLLASSFFLIKDALTAHKQIKHDKEKQDGKK